MNITEIIKQYLIDNKYDGLYNPNLNCGCEIINDDLFPCSPDLSHDCRPAYKHTYDGSCHENCDLDYDQNEKFCWCMKLKKGEE